jgi:hypothetical protein
MPALGRADVQPDATVKKRHFMAAAQVMKPQSRRTGSKLGYARFGASRSMTPKAECEVLMKEMLVFAERMLRDHGEFHPFGGTIMRDGGLALVSGWTGERLPPGADVIRVLTDGFRREAAAGDIRAAALVVNVSTQPPDQSNKVDAIRIALDHRDDYVVSVFFPYQVIAEGGVKLEAPFALKGSSFAFQSQDINL